MPALAALGRASFIAAFGHLYAPHDLAAFLDATHDLAKVAAQLDRADRAYAVIGAPGALLAYARLNLVSEFGHETGAKHPADLSQLYCAGECTGQRLGARLLDWAIDTAASHRADELRLSVWSENHGAQRFYARHGFVKVADIDFWVGSHRDDEFLLARAL